MQRDDLIAPGPYVDPHDAHKCTDECRERCELCDAPICTEFDEFIRDTADRFPICSDCTIKNR